MASAEHPPAACDYCGLPLGGIGSRHDSQPIYCCVGCRFAASVTADDGDAKSSQWTLMRLGLAIFFTMNVMVFTLVLWSRDVYRADAATVEIGSALYDLLRYACLLFSVPVLLLLGGPLLEQAWDDMRRRLVTVNGLLALGVVASFVYSALSLLTGGDHTYFEVGCMVLVAVTLGRWLEATGKLKTTQSLRGLQRLLPVTARLVTDGGPEDVPLASLKVGDCVRVLAGERVPVDGIVVRGHGWIDQQLITGESQPTEVQPDDELFGGSLNLDANLDVSVTATAAEGTLQRLVSAVEAAVARHGSEQRLADRLAAWFVPVVLIITLSTFVIHCQAAGFHAGLMNSLAVVLIACPCALGIATPLAVWAAMGQAARQQVLFRDGDALSRLARLRRVFFDKTGTLTTGATSVEHFFTEDDSQGIKVLAAAASLAAESTHPLALAIRSYAASYVSSVPTAMARTHSGLGVSGDVPELDSQVVLGSLSLMKQSGLAVPQALAQEMNAPSVSGRAISCVGWDEKVWGVFVFRQEIRPEAREMLAGLHRLQISGEVLTGDHATSGRWIASELDIEVRSGLLPEDKLAAIEDARGRGECVAMVGDGINDAPALAAADVGIAMGCGTDVTRDAGDVCLLGNDLCRLPWAIQLARRTVVTIRQNLFWALVYNVVGIVLAAAGMLNPILAAIAMVGSSLLVISNSLRLIGEPDATGAIADLRIDATGDEGRATRRSETPAADVLVRSRERTSDSGAKTTDQSLRIAGPDGAKV